MRAQRVFDGQGGLILAILAASTFVNILVLTAPLYMLQLFSRVMASGSLPTLVTLTLGAAVALLFFFLFDAIRGRLVARLASRVEARTGPRLLAALMSGRMPPELRGAQPLRDLQELRGFITSPMATALLDAPWSVLFLGIILLFHPVLGAVAAGGLAVLFGLGVLSEAAGRRPSREAAEAAVESTATAEEMVGNAPVAHAMGATRVLVDRWTLTFFSALVFGMVATDRVGLIASAAKAVRVGVQIALLATGVVLVQAGSLAPGAMIAASILLGRAAAPVEQSIAGWTGLLRARGAHRRLALILGHAASADGRMELPEPEGRLDVEAATVVLPGRIEPVLLDVSFSLRPGQSMALIGPSGAGKSTLLHALVGLQPLARGAVRLDDAALTDWPAEQVGRHVGFLPQRIDLFRGTVAENIALMDPEARPSDIVAAAKLAQVHEMILGLPGGYNFALGPRGQGLSAGQRQRIALARAFFGDRRLIVLDEPDANLDAEGEAALARAIRAACARGAVVVVVTHHWGLLGEVTHAAVLSRGRLERFGEARGVLERAAASGGLTLPEADPKVTPLRPRAASGPSPASGARA